MLPWARFILQMPLFVWKSLCSPNEDFGTLFKHSGTCFQSTFHISEYSIWATFFWKVLWKLCSPNEDFGRPIKHSGTHFQSTFHIRDYSIWSTLIWKVLWKLCSPNEDFRRLDKPSGTSFRWTLRGFVAQIEYSHPRKVNRKDVPDGLSSLRKSSFGRHKNTFPNVGSAFQNLRLGSIKIRSRMLDRPYKVFVWGA